MAGWEALLVVIVLKRSFRLFMRGAVLLLRGWCVIIRE